MKKMFSLFFILFTFVAFSTNAQSSWKKIFEDDVVRIYVDPGSIKKVSDPKSLSVYSVVDMMDYYQMAEGPNRYGNQSEQLPVSVVHTLLLDCASSTFRISGFYTYQTHNAVGSPNKGENYGSPWLSMGSSTKQFKSIFNSICR